MWSVIVISTAGITAVCRPTLAPHGTKLQALEDAIRGRTLPAAAVDVLRIAHGLDTCTVRREPGLVGLVAAVPHQLVPYQEWLETGRLSRTIGSRKQPQ